MCNELRVSFDGETLACDEDEMPLCLIRDWAREMNTCATCLDEFEDWS